MVKKKKTKTMKLQQRFPDVDNSPKSSPVRSSGRQRKAVHHGYQVELQVSGGDCYTDLFALFLASNQIVSLFSMTLNIKFSRTSSEMLL